MSFKDNTNEQLIILSRPSSIYRVVLMLTKSKPTTNRITIPILFPNRIENQIKRIIPILFQVGLGHGPLAGTWAIAQQTPPPAKWPNGLQVEDLLAGFMPAAHLQNSCLYTITTFISISEGLSLVIFSSSNNLSSRATLIQWYFLLICLDFEWKVECFVR